MLPTLVLSAIGTIFGLMHGNGAGGSGPPPSGCGATSCIITETGASDLQTEAGSNIITET